jgi:hypothetical protein
MRYQAWYRITLPECVSYVLEDSGWLGPHLARGHVDDTNPDGAKPAISCHGGLPVVRGQMPFAGVNLDYQRSVRPPGVRHGEQLAVEDQPRVEQRLGQPGLPDQIPEVALRW